MPPSHITFFPAVLTRGHFTHLILHNLQVFLLWQLVSNQLVDVAVLRLHHRRGNVGAPRLELVRQPDRSCVCLSNYLQIRLMQCTPLSHEVNRL